MLKLIKSLFARFAADQHLLEVMRGASSALMIRVFGTLLGFAVSVAIARILGAEGSGIYYLAVSVATIVATIARLGFDNTVVRFISMHASAKEWGGVKFVYGKVVRIVVVVSLLLSVLMYVGASYFAVSVFNKPFLEPSLKMVALSIFPLAMLMLHADCLRGLKYIAASQWIKTVLTSLFTLIFLLGCVEWFGRDGAVAAYAFAVLVTYMIAWYLWRRALKEVTIGSDSVEHEQYSLNKLTQSSWPLFGVVLTGLVMHQGVTILLGMSESAESVGIFNVASRITTLLLFPLIALISVLSPKFAALHRQGKRAELMRLARKSSLLLTIIALPVASVVYAEAGWIMSFFGAEFVGGIWIVRVLLIGVVINASTGAVAELLMMTGHERICRNTNLIGAIVTLGLCVALIPIYHEMGAAVAMAIGIATQNVLMVRAVRVHLNFWPIPFMPKRS